MMTEESFQPGEEGVLRRTREALRRRSLVRSNVRFMTERMLEEVEPELESVGGGAGHWSPDGRRFYPCYSANIIVDHEGRIVAAGTDLDPETTRRVGTGELIGFHLKIPTDGEEDTFAEQVVRVESFTGVRKPVTRVGRVMESSVRGYNHAKSRKAKVKFIDPSRNPGETRHDYESTGKLFEDLD